MKPTGKFNEKDLKRVPHHHLDEVGDVVGPNRYDHIIVPDKIPTPLMPAFNWQAVERFTKNADDLVARPEVLKRFEDSLQPWADTILTSMAVLHRPPRVRLDKGRKESLARQFVLPYRAAGGFIGAAKLMVDVWWLRDQKRFIWQRIFDDYFVGRPTSEHYAAYEAARLRIYRAAEEHKMTLGDYVNEIEERMAPAAAFEDDEAEPDELGDEEDFDGDHVEPGEDESPEEPSGYDYDDEDEDEV